MLSSKDKQVLCELGKQYMEFASLPIQQEKIGLWRALNRGEAIRPMVCIDQIPWHELNDNDELTCQIDHPYWGNIEKDLRMKIYQWKYFPVDMVLDPFIPIPKVAELTGYGLKIHENTVALDEHNTIVSHQYSNQIRDFEDISKIKDVDVIPNETESQLRLEQASEIFNTAVPFRQTGFVVFGLAVWDHVSEFMGLTDIYVDLVDRPEFLHAVLERITQATIAGIEKVNRFKLFNDNINRCHCSYIYTDELLPNSGAGKGPHTKNGWAYGAAQLFGQTSPDVFCEFELPYIKRMAGYFGMLYYGCCDRLDNKLEHVLTIPNVKKVSCSPWSDRDIFAEKIGRKVIMSNRPNPAFVAGDSVDYDLIAEDIKKTISAARRNNVNLELILKDISTVRYQPERLRKWNDLVMGIVS